MAFLSVQDIAITAVASVVPKPREDNHQLPFWSEAQKKQFIETTGIEFRHVAPPGTTAADLCLHAARKLLQSKNMDAGDIDIIVLVTQTPDYVIPGTSMWIQQELGASKNCICLDINQGCSGYVYGLSVIASMMQAGKLKKGLLLSGDTLTHTLYAEDSATVPVFSDAGSCTLLEYTEGAPSMQFLLQTDGSGYDRIILREGGSRFPEKTGRDSYLYMNGQDIFHFGLKEVGANILELMRITGTSAHDVRFLVMHQANMLLNESIRKKTGIEREKTLYSLQQLGNTSCASIPVTLCHHKKQGTGTYIFSGFGVGLSWASALVQLQACLVLPLYFE